MVSEILVYVFVIYILEYFILILSEFLDIYFCWIKNESKDCCYKTYNFFGLQSETHITVIVNVLQLTKYDL